MFQDLQTEINSTLITLTVHEKLGIVCVCIISVYGRQNKENVKIERES